MVDERGEKIQMVKEWWKRKYEITTGYSPGESESVTFKICEQDISIPKDLSCQCDWRTCRSRRGILDTSKKNS
jgi:hypothetical protein